MKRMQIRLAVALAGVLVGVQVAQAQTLRWDPAQSGGTSLGGNGTWDTTTANWWNGTANVAWSDGATAVFDGTPGTVTLNDTVSVNNLDVPTTTTSGWVISGSGTINGSTAASVFRRDIEIAVNYNHANSTAYFTSQNTPLVHFSGNISNTSTGGRLSLNSAGTIRLSGNNSGYIGIWEIRSFTRWQLASDNAFGSGTIRFEGEAATPGRIDAYGGPRTFTNQLVINKSELIEFGGGHDLTFTGNFSAVGTHQATLASTNTGVTTFSGLLPGNRNLEYRGPELLLLGGDNTYTGTTTVRGGTLRVNGTTTGQGNYIVGGGTILGNATLGGTGTIGLAGGNNLTVEGNNDFTATLLPGSGSGTMTINGDVTIGDYGRFAVRPAGGTATRLAITGALDLSSSSNTLEILADVPAEAGTYVLVTATGGITGEFAAVNDPAGLSWTVEYGANAITLKAPPAGTVISIH